jgi:hypothetical protein
LTTEQQREALKKAYTGPAWIKRVNKMPDDQVAAIYLNLKRQNKL